MEAIQQRRLRLSYILVLGMVYFPRFSLLTCFLHHLLFLYQNGTIGDVVKEGNIMDNNSNNNYDITWCQVVIGFGILLSSMQLGMSTSTLILSNINKSSSKNGIMRLCVYQIILCIIYVGICTVSRYFILFILFGLLGYFNTQCLFLAESHALIPSSYKLVSPNGTDKIKVLITMVFIFSTLLSGFLYNRQMSLAVEHSTSLSEKEYFGFYHAANLSPSLYNVLFIVILCGASLVYHGCLSIMLTHRSPKLKSLKNSSLSSAQVSNTESRNEYKLSSSSNPSDIDTNTSELTLTVDDLSLPIPINFLSICKGNQEKARTMFHKMLLWRRQNSLDEITKLCMVTELLKPPKVPQSLETFNSILKYYPHAIHGYALDGCSVVYEILGRANPSQLRKEGVSIDQLAWHFVLRNELVFQLQRQRRQGNSGWDGVCRMMTVLDVQGISMGSVTSDVISFIGRSGEIMDNYYPEQVTRLVICNSPRWFSTVWAATIARVLPDSVRKKIDIVQDTAMGLDKYIDRSQRPKAYGGHDVDLGEAAGHRAFLNLAQDWKRQEDLWLNRCVFCIHYIMTLTIIHL